MPVYTLIPKGAYSRQQRMPLRQAMATALCRLLQETDFPGPGGFGTIKIETAYDAWPSDPDEYVGPAACVLPGELQDVEGHLTPKLLEDTWEPDGEPGWGLYVLSEVEVEFVVTIRACSDAERQAIVAGVEQLFVQDREQMLIAPDRGTRWGVLLDLPEYFQSQARFGLVSTAVIDDEGTAMREQREATFTIQAQARKLRIGLVQPFTLKVLLDDETALTAAPTNQLEE